jgi:hypothetical protein
MLIPCVFAPLQATGFFVVHAGAIAALLVIMASIAIISASRTALAMRESLPGMTQLAPPISRK